MKCLQSAIVFISTLYFSKVEAVEYYEVTHRVTFSISIGDVDAGDVVIGLFGKIVPQTVNNFYTLATEGFDGKSYTGSNFHRVVKNFMIQGGDVVSNNGMGELSVFGMPFPDESFKIKHNMAGMLSMANRGPNTNGCQFFITTVATPWIDDKHVAFGKVIDGMPLVDRIGQLDTDYEEHPIKKVVVRESRGEIMTEKMEIASDPNNFWAVVKAMSIPVAVSGGIIGVLQWMSWQLKV